MESESHLVVGLGNPGSRYAATRHNLGFLVLQRLAQKWDWKFKAEPRFQGEIATGKIDDKRIVLLLPTTYMNLSGNAVRKVVDYYKIPFERENYFLVVVDDVYLHFDTLRLRDRGSSGGHNGLKSIEAHLNSQHFARLKMGIGPQLSEQDNSSSLEEYVLSTFSPVEQQKMTPFLDKGGSVIEYWLREGREAAVQKIAEQVNLRADEGEE